MRIFRLSLPVQILIAIVLAIGVGLFFGDRVSWLGPIGDAFVMLLRMSILPYIVVALIHGLGSLRVHQALRLLKLGGLFILAIWGVVIGTLFALTLVFPDRSPAYYYAQRAATAADAKQYVNLFIPGNPFHALANNIVPAVVVFCLFFGVALMLVKRDLKEPFLHMLEVATQVFSRITAWVIRISPLGVFALVGNTVGTISLAQLQKIEIYLFAFIVAALFFALWALPALVTAFTRVRYRTLMRAMQPAILLAFATGNIFVSLPYLMAGIEEIAKRSGFYTDDAKKVAKTLVPISYNLPLVGNLMAMFFVLFLGFFYAIDFTFFERLHLIAASIFTLAGPVTAGLNSISFLVDALRLPHDAVALFAETFSVTRNLQGLAGSMGIAVFTLLSLCAFTHHLRFHLGKLLINLCLGLVFLAAGIGLVVLIEPSPSYTKPIFKELHIDSDVKATVYRPGDTIPEPPATEDGRSLLDKVRNRGTLRVGYNPYTIPFAYFNDDDQLVGYDIALAYDLAQMLGVDLVFIPFDYDQLAQSLIQDRFDIAVSAVSVTPERLREMAFTSPTAEVEVVFVVPDYKRLDYANLKEVQRRTDLTLGALKGSALFKLAERKFPKAHIVPLETYNDYLTRPDIDALIWTDKEGLAWVLIHQRYSIVEPIPRIHTGYYAFALPLGAEELLDQVNYWLELKRLDGSIEVMQQTWIEGKPPAPPRRWSIIDNVLHWAN